VKTAHRTTIRTFEAERLFNIEAYVMSTHIRIIHVTEKTLFIPNIRAGFSANMSRRSSTASSFYAAPVCFHLSLHQVTKKMVWLRSELMCRAAFRRGAANPPAESTHNNGELHSS
jgi:hypothetical protein